MGRQSIISEKSGAGRQGEKDHKIFSVKKIPDRQIVCVWKREVMKINFFLLKILVIFPKLI